MPVYYWFSIIDHIRAQYKCIFDHYGFSIFDNSIFAMVSVRILSATIRRKVFVNIFYCLFGVKDNTYNLK